jgi:hypothetical protein
MRKIAEPRFQRGGYRRKLLNRREDPRETALIARFH